MCGITGFTHCNKHPSPAIIRTSTLALHHRGPDEQAVFESPNASLGVARLKIIDLEGGQQPMVTERGDWVIAFNGEIYNHAELRFELEQLGHEFRSHCDTEVALRAFTQWGVDCFPRFRGMFAAAFWHERERRLVLVRDRLGVKPLYYTLYHQDIFFGSELKAIFAHHQVPRNICRRALGYYLSLNYIPGPLTLVEGIEKVDPGTWLEWKNGQVKRGTYWHNVMRPEHIPIEEASCELDRLLAQSVREHVISDVPVGIWASGGIDSATVLHYAASQCTSRLRTFSLSFKGRGWDESRYFRSLAAHYGTRHQELDLNSDLDLTSAIHELAYYSDEPSADAGAVPVWFLSKMTARDVTVALSGEGADEVFGGYETYLADRYARVARRLPKPLLEAALSCARRLPVSDGKISFEYKLKRFLAGALLPADEAHFFWNGTFSREDQHTIASRYKPESLHQLIAQLSYLPEEDDLNRYLFLDQHWYLPDDILYKCDRMSMAHSLEVRPPFLDHRIVEFAARLPLALKIRRGNTKVILRKLIRGKVPKGILNRNKEGLDIPAHEWLRGPLRPLLLEALSPETVRKVGLLSSASIQRLIAQHSSRRANLGYHLWGLITLHLWIRRWNIQTEDQAAFVPLCSSATAAG